MGMIGRSISSGKLPSFRLSRGAPRSPTMKSTPISSTVEAADDIEDNSSVEADGGKQQVLGRKIMIVVDSSRESKVALQWALSHTAQSQDTILLLNVVKPSSSSSSSSSNININVSHAVDGDEMKDPRSYDLLCAMKRISQQKKPEVKVEICLVEGKDKGPVIVEAAKKQGAALLVLGSRKRRPMMVMWRLLMVWRGRGSGKGSKAVVDYCIKNASCMAVGVRRRGRRAGGGYLITTRKHKDFWLLA
ncbi:uncharacterized protein LOC110093516 [Dendrobium catenatum]|uniref:UspA domain-containing protein n=1 Tax=Dendrobium nobile TaxID=94219 RepID=A0A8T3AYA1_DENNO|nr:uncharacterized protein LOC110093516 [Dendrobium catenatum]KAI0501117.1 hypothetical protein KFK09_016060 [Dendrobium nobile]